MILQLLEMSERSPPDAFPDVEEALREPNGLLAIGGDLSAERLLCAYRRGIFPGSAKGNRFCGGPRTRAWR